MKTAFTLFVTLIVVANLMICTFFFGHYKGYLKGANDVSTYCIEKILEE